MTLRDTNTGVASFVAENAYSIGYSVLAEALALGLPLASLQKTSASTPSPTFLMQLTNVTRLAAPSERLRVPVAAPVRLWWPRRSRSSLRCPSLASTLETMATSRRASPPTCTTRRARSRGRSSAIPTSSCAKTRRTGRRDSRASRACRSSSPQPRSRPLPRRRPPPPLARLYPLPL